MFKIFNMKTQCVCCILPFHHIWYIRRTESVELSLVSIWHFHLVFTLPCVCVICVYSVSSNATFWKWTGVLIDVVKPSIFGTKWVTRLCSFIILTREGFRRGKEWDIASCIRSGLTCTHKAWVCFSFQLISSNCQFVHFGYGGSYG